MADHLRPMEEFLRIPIVVKQFFFGLENDDPHSHIRRFYQITQTLRLNQVPHDVVKLILFPFSLKGAAETWLENEPPNSITTWDDLVSKFLNRFYPHSKKREIRIEIMNFQQVFGETFTEAWERFKDLLRKSGGNLMMRNIQEALTTIENKAEFELVKINLKFQVVVAPQLKLMPLPLLLNKSKLLSIILLACEKLMTKIKKLFQLIQNQMGQMAEDLQERPSCVPPSNTVFVNVAIFNGFVEFGNGRGDAGDFGYFWDVGFSKGYIGGSGSWHFVT
ncbi:reverse transcriptase domain-containing protein [Tanacetum coccineum]